MSAAELVEQLSASEANALIGEAVRQIIPPLSRSITAEARKATERTLLLLPLLCERLERAEGVEARLISLEIRRVKRALEAISDDPYYNVIPAIYFQGATNRASARICNCDMVTIWRNRNRLLERLALLLFGVSAWGDVPLGVDVWGEMSGL